jgi:eukaryotic-like serine/threonine-protein kinase
MQRKHLPIAIITILIVLFTTGISILTSYVSNFLAPTFKPFALPLLVIIVLLVASLTAWLYFLQRDTNQSTLTLSNQNRQRMLARVYVFWIKGVLEQSLHGAAIIALGLKEQPDALAHPWHLVFQPPDQSPCPLPPGTRITQVYDEAGGELLILGEPGSGKTTLLLEIARDLLDRAKADETHPMPVVFNLSSWATKRQRISDWLVEELNIKYQVPRKLGKSWVDTDQILPLLDGLDEVAKEHLAVCVETINSYRREHMVPMVVCSRSTEYLNETTRVALNRSVVVQPLTTQQIDDYLARGGEQLASLRMVLRKNKILQELATTPLMLSILTLAYQGRPARDFRAKDASKTLQQQVFATYVQRMLQRRTFQIRYTSQQTIRWLTWLARQMMHHSQTEFYLERLQIDWFSHHPFYQLLLCISTGLFIAFFGWIVYSIFFWYKFGLIGIFTDAVYISLFFTIIYVLVNSLILPWLEKRKQIMRATGEEVRLRSWRSVLYFLLYTLDTRLGYGFLIGVPVGSLVGFIMGQAFGIISGLAYGLSNALILALEFAAFDKFSTEVKPVEIVVWSWTNTQRNTKESVLTSLGFALLMGTLFIIDSEFGLEQGIFLGLLYGIGMFIIGYVILRGLSQETLKKRDFDVPNQGIRRSAKNCLLFGTLTMCLSGLFFWLIHSLFGKPMEGIYYGTLTGVTFGGIVALWGGGFAFFQHYFVRIFLRSARYIPWKYVRFLDYAAEHILLRKVGGGYIFIHRLLQDYFASLDTP